MNSFQTITGEEYFISTDIDKMDVDTIHRYLSESSYWAKGIPKELVGKSIKYSLCFGVFSGDEQVGFARVVTDRTSFAYLGDVFILPTHQGKGLSKWLMQTIHDYPDLQGLRRWMLFTRDAHGLYSQFGWKQVPEEQTGRIMQIHNPNIYQ
ncbi:MAG: GNAT family N-acetyltransferase [Sediminibacterium sp.]|nr:GNAT family N-acetyltransferase [uncultured Sediminibacterium sp.]